MKKIILAGGTGFLGNSIIDHFSERDVQFVVLTRQSMANTLKVRFKKWDGKNLGAWTTCLEGADAVINLNGKSVDCRYTEKNKSLIYSTRLDSTAILGKAIQQAKNPPKLWINSASATIYRYSVDKQMDEYTGELGNRFSEDVCKKWEAVFESFELPATRKVLIRTGIVLGRNGGPMKPLKTLAAFGMGGKHGSGVQYCSWLHESDFVRAIEFIMNQNDLSGIFNVSAPFPVPNKKFMEALRNALPIKFGLPLGRLILEFGAVLIGTETELILKSRRVVPRRLLESGFSFQFERIENAFHDLCLAET